MAGLDLLRNGVSMQHALGSGIHALDHRKPCGWLKMRYE
jgi:hypothetical protein